MNRRRLPCAVSPATAVLAVALSAGCVFETSSPGIDPPAPREYMPLDSPENLLNNLVLAHSELDIDRYAEILAPEFRFVFPPPEDGSCGSGHWDREEDTLATAGLFEDSGVVELSLAFPHGPPEPATEAKLDGTWRIRSSTVEVLLIRYPNESLAASGDVHEFYFRPGAPAQGEDPDRWFLVEWRDLSQRSFSVSGGVGPSAIVGRHWWEIKCGYAPWIPPAPSG